MESSAKTDETVESPIDLRPRYYFGVTVDDLQKAGETPSVDNDVITTPPPDVVPHNEMSTTSTFMYPGTTNASQQLTDSV